MSVLSDFLPAGGGGATIARRELFTSNGTWTKPAGIVGEQVWVTMIGGGSSGSSSATPLGGASGQYIARFPVDVTSSSSVSVTVGSGGAGVNGGGADIAGNSGANSSFGALVTVLGGTAPDTNGRYVADLNGGNQGGSKSTGSSPVGSIPGVFGALSAFEDINRAPGGSGLLLDVSGEKGDDAGGGLTNKGGNGYGAGGGAADGSTTMSGAGAPGAVLVEWLESV